MDKFEKILLEHELNIDDILTGEDEVLIELLLEHKNIIIGGLGGDSDYATDIQYTVDGHELYIIQEGILDEVIDIYNEVYYDVDNFHTALTEIIYENENIIICTEVDIVSLYWDIDDVRELLEEAQVIIYDDIEDSKTSGEYILTSAYDKKADII